jgi:dTMP kinase
MVRGMVKDPQLSICDRAEALLFAAARAQLVEEVIVPALDQGKMVLLDRWIDSSKVYQGLARGLGTDPVARLSEFAVNGLTADRVLVLDVSERTARARMSERDGLNGADRIEQQLSAKVVRDGYRQLTELADDVYRVISAEGTPDEVLAEAAGALSDLF